MYKHIWRRQNGVLNEKEIQKSFLHNQTKTIGGLRRCTYIWMDGWMESKTLDIYHKMLTQQMFVIFVNHFCIVYQDTECNIRARKMENGK